ncbi:UNVERIFIED_CONTAM: hypothetical protein HDU68_009038 [Siphonaria sp. JEL0065]|nr:hypothetical protein HDU68_009038 [Siphonaria sp. JEL0065]
MKADRVVAASLLPNLTIANFSHGRLGLETFNHLERMPALKSLNLSSNELVGALPSNVGNLAHLQVLNLSKNRITAIPNEIANLMSLIELNISSNCISLFPSVGVCALQNLQVLDLSQNEKMSSRQPLHDISKLNNLKSLKLSNCNIQDSIPENFGNLSYLVDLDMSYNRLSGEIPNSIGKLTSLVALSLKFNKLSGSIPPEIFNLPALVTLDLARFQQLESGKDNSYAHWYFLETILWGLLINSISKESVAYIWTLPTKRIRGSWKSKEKKVMRDF